MGIQDLCIRRLDEMEVKKNKSITTSGVVRYSASQTLGSGKYSVSLSCKMVTHMRRAEL
jgi:hypothetical protein